MLTCSVLSSRATEGYFHRRAEAIRHKLLSGVAKKAMTKAAAPFKTLSRLSAPRLPRHLHSWKKKEKRKISKAFKCREKLCAVSVVHSAVHRFILAVKVPLLSDVLKHECFCTNTFCNMVKKIK
jgi:hypothetical protein